MDLDTLARMVAEGFLAIDKRFERLEMDLVMGLRGVNQRLDAMVELFDGHSERIKDLELAK